MKKIRAITSQNSYKMIHWYLMNKLPSYHIIISILTCPLLEKLLPSYGAIDRSQKQNDGGHWFLCLHIDGVVLTIEDAKINTGKLFF